MAKIAIIYHSGKGHTERQARAVMEGASKVEGVEIRLISIKEKPNSADIMLFCQEDETIDGWDYLNKADAIIFGSPTYMGSISFQFKKFMDMSSKVWFRQAWKDKLAAGFVNSGWPSGDKLNSMLQFVIFAAQHGMIWINPAVIPGNLAKKDPECTDVNRLGSFMGAMAMSPFDESAEIAPPECDLITARRLGERVAVSTLRWIKGK
ncbi:MAG: flavodoxin family protein [bacterium]